MSTMKIRGSAIVAVAAGILALAACGKTTSVASKSSPTPTPVPTASVVPTPTATATVVATPAVATPAVRSPTPKPSPTPSNFRLATPSPSPSPASTTNGATVFTDSSNGQTVHVPAGQQFSVSLGATYWMFDALPDATVLRSVGTPVIAPSPGCIPGGGCGTVTAMFVAVAPGQVTVAAHRQSCGEAMLCTGNAGQFTLIVVVP